MDGWMGGWMDDIQPEEELRMLKSDNSVLFSPFPLPMNMPSFFPESFSLSQKLIHPESNEA